MRNGNRLKAGIQFASMGVPSLTMRNGNPEPEIHPGEVYSCSQPNYEEWKLTPSVSIRPAQRPRSQPNYEEWKQ